MEQRYTIEPEGGEKMLICENGWSFAEVFGGLGSDNHLSDARRMVKLANSAPALLAAAKRVIYFRDTNDTPNSDPYAALRAAISAAEGGEA